MADNTPVVEVKDVQAGSMPGVYITNGRYLVAN